jgi:hypothetical protein
MPAPLLIADVVEAEPDAAAELTPVIADRLWFADFMPPTTDPSLIP